VRALAILLATAIVAIGCRRQVAPAPAPTQSAPVASDASQEEPPAAPSASARADALAPLAPLSGFFEALPVAGHPDAWISLPTGATSKRPVVIVVHGAGDRPDWQCGGWRRATSGFPFVVCPRGAVSARDSTKDDVRYTLAGGDSLRKYIDGALEALAARYPEYADTTPPILLAGFSLGSYEIASMAMREPSRFPSIVLVEGLTSGFDDARARAFAAAGGKRVLFGCGQRGCDAAARAAAQRIEKADGLEAAAVYAAVDHTFAEPLEDAVGAKMAWLVKDDPRWRLEPASPTDASTGD
jgi:pimeloyl-ACP methyl ester carboxylesterase